MNTTFWIIAGLFTLVVVGPLIAACLILWLTRWQDKAGEGRADWLRRAPPSIDDEGEGK